MESGAASTPALQSPSTHLSGHRLLGQIGAGGMGIVWLAMDERLDRKVAIKTLQPKYQNDEEVRTRFRQEALALAKLNHPNIVHIYNLGSPDESPHFVMEYLEGASLTEAAHALPLQQKVELFAKALRAVAFLHEQQIIHRDLKPSNFKVGTSLQPKLLDFGLARILQDKRRITATGELLGTPAYLSPEQTEPEADVDERSDVFSLGIILYEMLTGTLPFRGESVREQIRSICDADPVLPRRLNSAIPGDLQNICLKALERDRTKRYSSARDFADDFDRFLAQEPVLAAPTYYTRVTGSKIEAHVRDLEEWRTDHVISESEYLGLRTRYERLHDRQDAWIFEARQLSYAQVTEYLGAWMLVLGSALAFLFNYKHFSEGGALAVMFAGLASSTYLGLKLWRGTQFRIALAYLLAACILLPLFILAVQDTLHLQRGVLHERESWELFRNVADYRSITNAQIWWAIVLSLPGYVWLRRFTKSSAFSLVMAAMLLLLSLVTLLRMGWLDWVEHNPGLIYVRLFPFVIGFSIVAMGLERQRFTSDSQYFYPIAVGMLVTSLSGAASQYAPYAGWVGKHLPWTHANTYYLFLVNGIAYALISAACDRYHTSQLRKVALALRLLVPGHILFSILQLMDDAKSRWDSNLGDLNLRNETRFFEFLLPIMACLFVVFSVRRQMKNYVISGLFFFGLGIISLQLEYFFGYARWPVAVSACGLLLMLVAIHYASMRAAFSRWIPYARFLPTFLPDRQNNGHSQDVTSH